MLQTILLVLSFTAGVMILIALGICVDPPESGYGNKNHKK